VFGIREVTSLVPAEALRLFLISTHYRSPMDFSLAAVEESFRALVRLYETLARVDANAGKPSAPPRPILPPTPRLASFVAAMDDDLNSAQAVAVLFDLVRELNRLLDAGDLAVAADVRRELASVAAVLGVGQSDPEEFLAAERKRALAAGGLDSAEVERRIAQRAEARGAKDWQRADEIRAKLLDSGIALEDGTGETTWRPVSWGVEPTSRKGRG